MFVVTKDLQIVEGGRGILEVETLEQALIFVYWALSPDVMHIHTDREGQDYMVRLGSERIDYGPVPRWFVMAFLVAASKLGYWIQTDLSMAGSFTAVRKYDYHSG